ncbi:MAG: ABC transporter permease [Candidatus Micrarchaeota archaeon]|nr:ABC transporter permease [Candidatus Micrarchaeota archaeon]MCX8154391.1 ABC transporter permease [Candidatus Micrarchaeota archaeon]
MISKLILKFLLYNKIRTSLVVLSVFISSLFFISILGFGNAAKESIVNTLNRLSSDIILIIPLAIDNPLFLQRSLRTGLIGEAFRESDLKQISELPGVLGVYRTSGFDVTVSTRKEEFRLQVFAIEEEGVDLLFDTAELQEGRPILVSGNVFVGGGIADRYDMRVGDTIRINNRSFKIAGIFKKIGPNLFNIDNGIFLLNDDLVELADLDRNRVYSMVVKFDSSTDEETLRSRIHEILDRSRKIKDTDARDYSLLSGSAVSKQIGNLIDVLRYFFLVISGVSIFVSLINLTNNLYIFITEKYKQLATMKVLGGDSRFIYTMILGMSSAFIILGILPTILIVSTISLLNLPFILYATDIYISISLLILSILITSYFPSRAALSIQPAEALRYE